VVWLCSTKPITWRKMNCPLRPDDGADCLTHSVNVCMWVFYQRKKSAHLQHGGRPGIENGRLFFKESTCLTKWNVEEIARTAVSLLGQLEHVHLELNPLQFGRHYQLGCRLLLPDWHWWTGSWSISIWNCSSIATLKQTTFVPSLREAPSRGISCWCRNPNSTVVCFTPMFDSSTQFVKSNMYCVRLSISNLKYVSFCWLLLLFS
jgi:hypothetical protein